MLLYPCGGSLMAGMSTLRRKEAGVLIASVVAVFVLLIVRNPASTAAAEANVTFSRDSRQSCSGAARSVIGPTA